MVVNNISVLIIKTKKIISSLNVIHILIYYWLSFNFLKEPINEPEKPASDKASFIQLEMSSYYKDNNNQNNDNRDDNSRRKWNVENKEKIVFENSEEDDDQNN